MSLPIYVLPSTRYDDKLMESFIDQLSLHVELDKELTPTLSPLHIVIFRPQGRPNVEFNGVVLRFLDKCNLSCRNIILFTGFGLSQQYGCGFTPDCASRFKYTDKLLITSGRLDTQVNKCTFKRLGDVLGTQYGFKKSDDQPQLRRYVGSVHLCGGQELETTTYRFQGNHTNNTNSQEDNGTSTASHANSQEDNGTFPGSKGNSKEDYGTSTARHVNSQEDISTSTASHANSQEDNGHFPGSKAYSQEDNDTSTARHVNSQEDNGTSTGNHANRQEDNGTFPGNHANSQEDNGTFPGSKAIRQEDNGTSIASHANSQEDNGTFPGSKGNSQEDYGTFSGSKAISQEDNGTSTGNHANSKEDNGNSTGSNAISQEDNNSSTGRVENSQDDECNTADANYPVDNGNPPESDANSKLDKSYSSGGEANSQVDKSSSTGGNAIIQGITESRCNPYLEEINTLQSIQEGIDKETAVLQGNVETKFKLPPGKLLRILDEVLQSLDQEQESAVTSEIQGKSRPLLGDDMASKIENQLGMDKGSLNKIIQALLKTYVEKTNKQCTQDDKGISMCSDVKRQEDKGNSSGSDAKNQGDNIAGVTTRHHGGDEPVVSHDHTPNTSRRDVPSLGAEMQESGSYSCCPPHSGPRCDQNLDKLRTILEEMKIKTTDLQKAVEKKCKLPPGRLPDILDEVLKCQQNQAPKAAGMSETRGRYPPLLGDDMASRIEKQLGLKTGSLHEIIDAVLKFSPKKKKGWEWQFWKSDDAST